jgi:hypothetical protein
MIKAIFKGIRMNEILAAQCEAAAARAQMPFSKWARETFRQALGLDRNGKRRKP